jgi:hypothetical protein
MRLVSKKMFTNGKICLFDIVHNALWGSKYPVCMPDTQLLFFSGARMLHTQCSPRVPPCSQTCRSLTYQFQTWPFVASVHHPPGSPCHKHCTCRISHIIHFNTQGHFWRNLNINCKKLMNLECC